MPGKHNINSSSLRAARKYLRTHSTSAEAELWKYLSEKKLEGRKFRRQYSIGNYILDFYCVSEKLAVELDGNPHGDYVQIQKDLVRDEYLEKSGIRTIRIENRIVFQDQDYVLQLIKSFLEKPKHTTSSLLRRGTPPNLGGESSKQLNSKNL
jgi:very-short-patch-repair endonuclease